MSARNEHRSPLTHGIVAAAALVAVAMLALPLWRDGDRDARLTRMLAQLDTYRAACLEYRRDTGSRPVEHSDATASELRQLSVRQAEVPGWDGAYLQPPRFAAGDVVAASTRIEADLDRVTGFDLDGDGTVETRGAASVVVLRGIGARTARQLDARLDGAVGGDWALTGRVEWRRSGILIVLLAVD